MTLMILMIVLIVVGLVVVLPLIVIVGSVPLLAHTTVKFSVDVEHILGHVRRVVLEVAGVLVHNKLSVHGFSIDSKNIRFVIKLIDFFK